MSPNVAVCRRSVGQILGQPLVLRALFSLLCVSDPQPQPPDGWPDPTDDPRRARACSAYHVAPYSHVEAPPTVPFCSSQLLAFLLAEEVQAFQAAERSSFIGMQIWGSRSISYRGEGQTDLSFFSHRSLILPAPLADADSRLDVPMTKCVPLSEACIR